MNDNDLQMVKYKVIESTEQWLRRTLRKLDPSVLEKKHSLGQGVSSIVYTDSQRNCQYHGEFDAKDRRYIDLYDKFYDRYLNISLTSENYDIILFATR